MRSAWVVVERGGVKALDPLRTAVAGAEGPLRPTDWRFSWTSSESSQVGVRDRQRAGVHSPLTIGRGFGLDYLFQWSDGRISTGVAERLAIEDPGRFLHLAREAAYEDPDGANFLGPASMPGTELLSDPVAAEARNGGEMSFAPLLAEAGHRAEAWKFTTWSGSVSATVIERGVETSRGLQASSVSTRAGYSFWYEGRTGDGHARRVLVASEEAASRLERACALVRRLLEPETSFEPGRMPLLVHPTVVESLVSTYLLGNLHGERIFHGQSAFRIEQFGSPETVFAPDLALRLDPSVPMDIGSYRFTTEGVPARPLPYIEQGRLVNPILDLKYAKRLRRGPVPGPIAFDSLRFEGRPPVAESEALRLIPRGVLVLSLLGLHTQDTTRGDFSVAAPQSLAIRSGTLGGGLKAVLTGNFFEVLRDPRLTFVAFEGFRTPGLLFDGSVAIEG